ncbi:hypothetical protein FIBSPDRAFT_960963 [Athelia psychrophila]|uniref:DUF6533 domain-containing protein n=1 Tax=Athelia psychrophila TaxID=1759441 RepID=A0A166BVX4_9AGAM|nr:hypothetical protein FIBSPDRAFT_960963 [Fibularhizoctonia sp. CBS 109695]
MQATFPPIPLLDIDTTLQQTQIAIYIILASLTAVIWDWLLSLAEEYRVMKRCGRSAATFAYFTARASALILCVLVYIFYTGIPDGDSCFGIFHGTSIMIVLGNAAKAYLFLLRVRAVYGGSTLVTFCVATGACVLVGSRLAGMFLVHVSPLAHTRFCQVNAIGSLSAIALWFNWVYDTCVFAAISVRLTSYTRSTTTVGTLSIIRGYGLPRTMRHVLQDGQLYYVYVPVLISVLGNLNETIISTVCAFMLLAAIMAVLPHASPVYQAAFTIPPFAMESNMVCKMFRAMIIRSLEFDPRGCLSLSEACTNAMTSFEQETTLELNTRVMVVDSEDVGYDLYSRNSH